MRIFRLETAKLLKSPMLWLLPAIFFLLNFTMIYNTYGYQEVHGEISQVHGAILDYGVALPKPVKNSKESNSQSSGNELADFYVSYVDTYRTLYDTLDMTKIKERKQQMYQYYPTGAYKDFVDSNYRKLQERVEEIKKTGEGQYGFYPGRAYRIHGHLYANLTQTLLLQSAILIVLCVLYLMGYERVHLTQNLVLTSRTGKGIMRDKALAGLTIGMLSSVLLFACTYSVFFYHVDFQGLWDVPVSSAILAEERMQVLLYPFITFWKITVKEYFILSMLVSFLLLLSVGCFIVAVHMFLQNSYLAFLLQILLNMGMFVILSNVNTATFLDLIKALNPIYLWGECGTWFMENSLILSFPGSEFLTLGISLLAAILFLAGGKAWYRRWEEK